MNRFLARSLRTTLCLLCLLASMPSRSQSSVTPEPLKAGESVNIAFDKPEWSGRSVRIRYGFNGWDLRFKGAQSSEAHGSRSYFRNRALQESEQREGHFSVTIDTPKEARALHYVFCVDDCSSGDWDNNRGRDYGRSLVFPYIGPILTWSTGDRPGRDLTISFEEPELDAAWLRYRPEGGRWQRLKAQERSTPTGWFKFRLKNLDGPQNYEYQLGSPAGHLSEVFHFDLPGERRVEEELRFAVIGDMQDDGQSGRYSRVTRELVKRIHHVDFIISPGDLPWNDLPGDWWTFFDQSRDLLAQKAFMPAVGNHDTPGNSSNWDARSFGRYFSLPDFSQEKTWYSFRYGLGGFIALNSERPEEFAPFEKQFNALADWVASGDHGVWNFALWHIGPMNAGNRHTGRQYASRRLSGLLTGTVDWAFSGHEHLYQRFKPTDIRYGWLHEQENYGRDSVGYIVIPPAGSYPNTRLVRKGSRHQHIRDYLAYPDVPASIDRVASSLGFILVSLTQKSIRIETYQERGEGFEIVDSVSYKREP